MLQSCHRFMAKARQETKVNETNLKHINENVFFSFKNKDKQTSTDRYLNTDNYFEYD